MQNYYDTHTKNTGMGYLSYIVIKVFNVYNFFVCVLEMKSRGHIFNERLGCHIKSSRFHREKISSKKDHCKNICIHNVKYCLFILNNAIRVHSLLLSKCNLIITHQHQQYYKQVYIYKYCTLY